MADPTDPQRSEGPALLAPSAGTASSQITAVDPAEKHAIPKSVLPLAWRRRQPSGFTPVSLDPLRSGGLHSSAHTGRPNAKMTLGQYLEHESQNGKSEDSSATPSSAPRPTTPTIVDLQEQVEELTIQADQWKQFGTSQQAKFERMLKSEQASLESERSNLKAKLLKLDNDLAAASKDKLAAQKNLAELEKRNRAMRDLSSVRVAELEYLRDQISDLRDSKDRSEKRYADIMRLNDQLEKDHAVQQAAVANQIEQDRLKSEGKIESLQKKIQFFNSHRAELERNNQDRQIARVIEMSDMRNEHASEIDKLHAQIVTLNSHIERLQISNEAQRIDFARQADADSLSTVDEISRLEEHIRKLSGQIEEAEAANVEQRDRFELDQGQERLSYEAEIDELTVQSQTLEKQQSKLERLHEREIAQLNARIEGFKNDNVALAHLVQQCNEAKKALTEEQAKMLHDHEQVISTTVAESRELQKQIAELTCQHKSELALLKNEKETSDRELALLKAHMPQNNERRLSEMLDQTTKAGHLWKKALDSTTDVFTRTTEAMDQKLKSQKTELKSLSTDVVPKLQSEIANLTVRMVALEDEKKRADTAFAELETRNMQANEMKRSEVEQQAAREKASSHENVLFQAEISELKKEVVTLEKQKRGLIDAHAEYEQMTRQDFDEWRKTDMEQFAQRELAHAEEVLRLQAMDKRLNTEIAEHVAEIMTLEQANIAMNETVIERNATIHQQDLFERAHTKENFELKDEIMQLKDEITSLLSQKQAAEVAVADSEETAFYDHEAATSELLHVNAVLTEEIEKLKDEREDMFRSIDDASIDLRNCATTYEAKLMQKTIQCDKTIAQKVAESEKTIKQQIATHEKDLKQKIATHEKDLKQKAMEHQDFVMKHEKQMKQNAKQNAMQNAMEHQDLVTKHRKEVKQNAKQNAMEHQDLVTKHEKQMKQNAKQNALEYQDLVTKHEKETKQIAKQNAKEYQDVTMMHEKRIKQNAKEHQDFVSMHEKQIKQNAKEYQDLSMKHEKTMKEKAKEYQDLATKHEKKLEQKAEEHQDLVMKHEQKMKQKTKEHEDFATKQAQELEFRLEKLTSEKKAIGQSLMDENETLHSKVKSLEAELEKANQWDMMSSGSEIVLTDDGSSDGEFEEYSA